MSSFTMAGAMLTGTPRLGLKEVNVPFLPGFRDHPAMARARGHCVGRGHSGHNSHDLEKAISNMPKLDLSNLQQTLKDPMYRYNETTRSMTHDEKSAMKESARNTYRPRVPPAWLKYDGHVLHFLAYFQEPVHENPKENFRVRECVIYFFLEDGSMMIMEPKIENSGIPQGTFIKRHKIPKPSEMGEGYFTEDDLDCGITIVVYSRSFRVVDCDKFTRSYYQNVKGKNLSLSEEMPLDNFRTALRDTGRGGGAGTAPASPSPGRNKDIQYSKEYTELSLGGNRKNLKLQQYLENDRKVLCFKVYWDDATRYGARMYYIMHFYLADDTLELLEALPRNSGRDPYPVFWKRQTLRKNPHVNPAPGMNAPDPVLYKPEDFIVGSTVDFYGRDIFIYDCDDFTRDFFRQYIGIEQGSIKIPEPQLTHLKLSPPPHTGFGTEEDSLGSCYSLTPRVPRRDYTKLMEMADKAMRFEGKMVEATDEERNRRFVVAIHLADDSVSVWEMPQRNSGLAGGKFAAKARQRNRDTGKWLSPKDFYEGATVSINCIRFLLGRTDEATLRYMEERPAEFPMSNPRFVASRFVGMKEELKQGPDTLPLTELAELAASKLEVQLTAPELTTLRRKFGEPGDPERILVPKLLELLA